MGKKIINGKYADAVVFVDNPDEETEAQIRNLVDHELTAGEKVRIMPDCHAGLGCVIGCTMTISDRVVPNLVGVDIGCGVLVVELMNGEFDPKQLDDRIRRKIPAGFKVREKPHRFIEEMDLRALHAFDVIDERRALLSIGSLGGGNHFIEVATAPTGRRFLLIHSGSRHLGQQIALHYQKIAEEMSFAPWIEKLKSEHAELGKKEPSERQIKALKKKIPAADRELMYLEGRPMLDYLDDMVMVQRYASLNRAAIADEILDVMNWQESDRFETVHNYIDMEERILRKGAVSAKAGEKLLIPLNMRDGSLICVGKGNPEWNNSAPHGAGRLMSRKMAREVLKLEQFEESMQGIYTTCISRATLDEAPAAYKAADRIIESIGETVDIVDHLRPVYNFKSK